MLAAYRKLKEENGKSKLIIQASFALVIMILVGINFDLRINTEEVSAESWAAFFFANALYLYALFGLLFSLGLYAHYKAEPAAFIDNYDDLLSATGMDDAATLAARFGIDVRNADFWKGSLDLIAEDVKHFRALIENAA